LIDSKDLSFNIAPHDEIQFMKAASLESDLLTYLGIEHIEPFIKSFISPGLAKRSSKWHDS
jgi:hypothetical protein